MTQEEPPGLQVGRVLPPHGDVGKDGAVVRVLGQAVVEQRLDCPLRGRRDRIGIERWDRPARNSHGDRVLRCLHVAAATREVAWPDCTKPRATAADTAATTSTRATSRCRLFTDRMASPLLVRRLGCLGGKDKPGCVGGHGLTCDASAVLLAVELDDGVCDLGIGTPEPRSTLVRVAMEVLRPEATKPFQANRGPMTFARPIAAALGLDVLVELALVGREPSESELRVHGCGDVDELRQLVTSDDPTPCRLATPRTGRGSCRSSVAAPRARRG